MGYDLQIAAHRLLLQICVLFSYPLHYRSLYCLQSIFASKLTPKWVLSGPSHVNSIQVLWVMVCAVYQLRIDTRNHFTRTCPLDELSTTLKILKERKTFRWVPRAYLQGLNSPVPVQSVENIANNSHLLVSIGRPINCPSLSWRWRLLQNWSMFLAIASFNYQNCPASHRRKTRLNIHPDPPCSPPS